MQEGTNENGSSPADLEADRFKMKLDAFDVIVIVMESLSHFIDDADAGQMPLASKLRNVMNERREAHLRAIPTLRPVDAIACLWEALQSLLIERDGALDTVEVPASMSEQHSRGFHTVTNKLGSTPVVYCTATHDMYYCWVSSSSTTRSRRIRSRGTFHVYDGMHKSF